MAISYDSSSKGQTGRGGGAVTWAHTCSGTNRYLFVATNDVTTDVTYNGVALTSLSVTTGGTANLRVWGLANPDTGTHNISATNNNSGYLDQIVAVSYNGIDATQPIASQLYNSTGTNVYSLTGTTTTIDNGDWLLFFPKGNHYSTSSPSLTNTTGTLRQSYPYAYTAGAYVQSAASCIDSNGEKGTPGAYSLITTWTGDGFGPISGVIYAIKPYLEVTMTGPSSGNAGATSTNFTVTPNFAITGTVTITPSGTGSSGLSPTVLTFSNSNTPQTFTITPTVAGTVTLTMTNSVSYNNASPINYTVNGVVPTAPTIGTAVPGNTTASVSFTDNFNGGSAITSHRVISTPGSITGTGTSPITVTGLTNGVSYTFTARATNSTGNSAESSASNSATPYVPASSFTFTGPSGGAVRAASTNFTVTPNTTYNGTITITPTGVGSTGLSPKVLTWALSSAAQTFTITPLASGDITLTCTNSNSISNASPLTYTATAVVPLAPTVSTAQSTVGGARVECIAPTNDGGATITTYTATSTPGSITGTKSSPGIIDVNGLTNGTSYTFTVTATNSAGTSAPSSASNAVIPTASSTNFTNGGPKLNIERNVGNILSF